MGLNQNDTSRFKFLEKSFILNTRSTLLATIMNEDLVTNIRQAKIPILMTTNAGTKVLTTEADILNFGKAMVDTMQSANVLGFSHFGGKVY